MRLRVIALLMLAAAAVTHSGFAAVEIVGSFNGWVTGVDAHRDPSTGRTYAYALQGSQVHIYDVASLRLLNTLRVPAFQLFGIHVSGSRMALAAGANGAFVYSLDTPEHPVLVYRTPQKTHEVWLGVRKMIARNWDVIGHWDNFNTIPGLLSKLERFSPTRAKIMPSSSGSPVVDSRVIDLESGETDRYWFIQAHWEFVPKYLGVELDEERESATFYSYTFQGMMAEHESDLAPLPNFDTPILTSSRREVIGVTSNQGYIIAVYRDAIEAFLRAGDGPSQPSDTIHFPETIERARFDNKIAYLQSAETVHVVDLRDPENLAVLHELRVDIPLGAVIGDTTFSALRGDGLSVLRLGGPAQPEFRSLGEYRNVRNLWSYENRTIAYTEPNSGLFLYEQQEDNELILQSAFERGMGIDHIEMDGERAVFFTGNEPPGPDIFRTYTITDTGGFQHTQTIDDFPVGSLQLIHLRGEYFHMYDTSPGGRRWLIHKFGSNPFPTRLHIFDTMAEWVGHTHGNGYYFIRPQDDSPSVLHCLDMSNPEKFPVPRQYALPASAGEYAEELRINGHYLCVLNENSQYPFDRYIRIFDVRSLNAIRDLGTIDLFEPGRYSLIKGMLLHGNHLLILKRPAPPPGGGSDSLILVYNLLSGGLENPVSTVALNNSVVDTMAAGANGTILMPGEESGILVMKIAEESVSVTDWRVY